MEQITGDFTQPGVAIAAFSAMDGGFMTIQSYLVYPASGGLDEVETALSALPGCEVLRAENRPVLILVTETDSRDAQRNLERSIEQIENVTCLALVSGWKE